MYLSLKYKTSFINICVQFICLFDGDNAQYIYYTNQKYIREFKNII